MPPTRTKTPAAKSAGAVPTSRSATGGKGNKASSGRGGQGRRTVVAASEDSPRLDALETQVGSLVESVQHLVSIVAPPSSSGVPSGPAASIRESQPGVGSVGAGTDEALQAMADRAVTHGKGHPLLNMRNFTIHVSDAARQKIKFNKYVDLSSLENKRTSEPTSLSHTVTDTSTTFTLTDYRPLHSLPPASYLEWNSLFLLFSSLYLTYYPSDSIPMIYYMMIIRDLSNNHSWSFARRYDEFFRRQ